MKKKQVLVVLSNAAKGREDEYNHWYSNTHLRDQLKVPGFVGAQRFKLSETQMAGAPPGKWQYAAIYDIESDDPAEALAETRRRMGTSQMPIPDGLITNLWGYVFEPITGRITPEDEHKG